MSVTEQSRTTWLELTFDEVPALLMRMREDAESVLGAQDTSAVRVSGSSEKARLPYRVAAADDADELWSVLVEFAREVGERTGNPTPRPVREFVRTGRLGVWALPSCTPRQAFEAGQQVARYLRTCAHQIAHDGGFNDSPDTTAKLIRRLRRQYPDTPEPPRRYLDHRCPTCGERGLHLAVAGDNPIVRCAECRERWSYEDYFR